MEKVSIKPDWVRGDCIGKGAFGTVSVAANKADGRVFAVKSVELSSCSTCQAEALESEIRILRSLSSPYVVGYLGDDTTCEQGAAAACRNLHMECLPGGTAAELGAGVDERILRSYTWCVLSALRYVHGKGIVHCDVKGRNVLLGPGPGSAKLADFGSAVELGSGVPPRGSPLWMAPEVIRGENQGPESDVWSLGCTVIEMFTGKPAWEDRGVDTLCRIGYSGDLPELPSRLSELGRDFVGKCLRREVSERWSCDQLLQHPFVASCSPPSLVSDWSPRCVLDSFDSNYSDEEEDQQTFDETDAKERIGKLASNAGANWESDGCWVVVRNLIGEEEEREGTISEYHELVRTEEGSCGRSSEYSDAMPTGEVSGGTNWEFCYSNGLSMEEEHGFGAGSSYATYGPNKEDEGSNATVVEMTLTDSHSTIRNHLFSYNNECAKLGYCSSYCIAIFLAVEREEKNILGCIVVFRAVKREGKNIYRCNTGDVIFNLYFGDYEWEYFLLSTMSILLRALVYGSELSTSDQTFDEMRGEVTLKSWIDAQGRFKCVGGL